MVHRPESDEVALTMFDADPAAGPVGPVPPLGPAPARFPTPQLPSVPRPPSTTRRAPLVPAPPTRPVPGPEAREATPEGTELPGTQPPATVRASAPVTPMMQVPTDPRQAPLTDLLTPGGREHDTGAAERTGHRRRRGVVGATATLVVLVAGGAATVPLLTGNSPAPAPAPPAVAPPTEPVPRDVTPDDLRSRAVDRKPLTAKEVFPSRDLLVADGGTAYRVLKTQSSASCGVAVTGEINDLLDRLDCNQVVRGTLRTPDGAYLMTAGLFNLADRAGAEQARDRIKSLVDSRKGRFQGMSAGRGTEAVARSSARVGWQAQGHYLAYCVVARSNGKTIRSGDQTARNILNDLLEGHLRQGVLARRVSSAQADAGGG
ncbi:hypothetical protein [Micromonospora echinofusca]|uniref:Uncharacterized protein n=1 Tax=Micromonospora echinofusca TaxID=47858 RepID=A0ABS3VJK9_MICEH|nr:hypothetical protein [Micromonospora echinofusca]MBO4204713.1 hypothetical protein [Micromonospora echinofusca]